MQSPSLRRLLLWAYWSLRSLSISPLIRHEAELTLCGESDVKTRLALWHCGWSWPSEHPLVQTFFQDRIVCTSVGYDIKYSIFYFLAWGKGTLGANYKVRSVFVRIFFVLCACSSQFVRGDCVRIKWKKQHTWLEKSCINAHGQCGMCCPSDLSARQYQLMR